eukprot:jgi/Astpho2/5000/Aster-05938
MPFRCPACHHFSDQLGHFEAHVKPRKFNCKGWDLLTDADKDPDSNRITQQDHEEALAAAKAQKRKREEEVEAKPSAQAAALSHPSRICFKDIEWVEGEIDELEEAGPLSAKHKKFRKLLEQRAAQHNRGAQLFTKHNVTAISRWEDQTRGLKSQIWNS